MIRHLFVPHHTNRFRAWLLHEEILFSIVALLFLVGTIFTQAKAVHGSVLGFATDVTISKIADDVNKERAAKGLSPLTINDKLTIAAERKADDMFANNYWAHFSPQGKSPWDFIQSAGYSYKYAGENLAENFAFSDDVVKGWMNSPTHRANVLKGDYTDVGYAVKNGILKGQETTLVVQMFGNPLEGAVAGKPTGTTHSVTVPPTAATTTNSGIVMSRKVIFNASLALIGLFLIALSMDWYAAAHQKLLRTHGRNVAHVIFFFVMGLGLIIMTKGTVIAP